MSFDRPKAVSEAFFKLLVHPRVNSQTLKYTVCPHKNPGSISLKIDMGMRHLKALISQTLKVHASRHITADCSGSGFHSVLPESSQTTRKVESVTSNGEFTNSCHTLKRPHTCKHIRTKASLYTTTNTRLVQLRGDESIFE